MVEIRYTAGGMPYEFEAESDLPEGKIRILASPDEWEPYAREIREDDDLSEIRADKVYAVLDVDKAGWDEYQAALRVVRKYQGGFVSRAKEVLSEG